MLLNHSINNAFDGWLETRRNVRSSNVKTLPDTKKHKFSPCQLELAVTNIVLLVVIADWTKFDELRLLNIAKSVFSSFIKTSNDVIQVFYKWGVRKKSWWKEWGELRDVGALHNLLERSFRASTVTKIEPWK